MQIEIQARDFTLTSALRDYIDRRLAYALGGRYEKLKRVIVRISDTDARGGGNRKRCQIHIKMPRLRDVVIQDTKTDLYSAIDCAADRAGRTVNRRLERQFYKSRRLFLPRRSVLTNEELFETGLKS